MAQAIDVRGLYAVQKALADIAPDLRREMYRELGSSLKARVDRAKADMPVGNHPITKTRADGSTYTYRRPRRAGHLGLRRYTRLSKRGSKFVKQFAGHGGRRQGLFGFVAITGPAHGSILDLAQQPHSKQGATLISTLNQRYGPAPRFLGKQFLGPFNRKQMYRESQRLVNRYIDHLNRRIESTASTRVVA